jgi:hypothetical protein
VPVTVNCCAPFTATDGVAGDTWIENKVNTSRLPFAELAPSLPAPEKIAEIVCAPGSKLVVVNLATPAGPSIAVPSVKFPSRNVTSPLLAGVALPATVTVAVRLTGWP